MFLGGAMLWGPERLLKSARVCVIICAGAEKLGSQHAAIAPYVATGALHVFVLTSDRSMQICVMPIAQTEQ